MGCNQSINFHRGQYPVSLTACRGKSTKQIVQQSNRKVWNGAIEHQVNIRLLMCVFEMPAGIVHRELCEGRMRVPKSKTRDKHTLDQYKDSHLLRFIYVSYLCIFCEGVFRTSYCSIGRYLKKLEITLTLLIIHQYQYIWRKSIPIILLQIHTSICILH